MSNLNEKKLIASMLLSEAAVGKIDGNALKTFTASVNKSRAINDPEGLSDDLGLEWYNSGTDAEKVFKCLRDAQRNNIIMKKCYLPPEINGEIVQMRFLEEEAANWKFRFVELALIAAEKSGRLKLDKRAILRRGDDERSVVIYFR